MRKITLVLLCLVGLAGCSAMDYAKESVSGIYDYFSGGEDNSTPPTPLVEYHQELEAQIVWKESIGVGADGHTLKLIPAIGGGKVIAADREGVVQARDAKTGNLLWEVQTEIPFSAGPGLAAGRIILGSSKAKVVALNSENGEQLWEATVSSEVLAVPVIAKGIVLVRTAAGTVVALDEKTGRRLWDYEHSVPALSIRGTGMPLVIKDNVIVGYDNGKLVALKLSNGKYVWETTIAMPKGRSEIERLVDLDVDPVEVDGTIYIASYNGGISAVSASDGEVMWRNEKISSHTGLSYDSSHLYLSDSIGQVLQIEQSRGAGLWSQKELNHRKLTAPTLYQNYVVVGDFEGYVHWLSTRDGRQLGRVQITDTGIGVKPVIADGIVYVYAKDGTLAALTAH
ncbi:MAG: outer membrane protein assembly factor BamB [Methylococcales bacterium]|nr:outer membrane protein assembly factor BamB [Methylococcales bacterium]